LSTWGLVRSTIDVCLYTLDSPPTTGRPRGSILWVLIYVDDALIADNDSSLRDRFVADLSKRFPTEDKGELTWILNMGVRRDRPKRTLILSQELYVADLLSKYASFMDASTTRTFDTPMDDASPLSVDDCPTVGSDEHTDLKAQREIYMSIVGGLLWLANMTRFDIAFAASQLSRALTNPSTMHLKAAARVLIYLRHSQARTLLFQPNTDLFLDTYVDSSWSTRFSCSGAMYFIHGCLFHWFSKMQRSVTLSSAEAEYFGAMLAARDLLFIRELLLELGLQHDKPSVIHCDSKSAVDMAFDPVAFKKTKHILRAAEFLRDLVLRDVVILTHIAGTLMIADILTKAVARPMFRQLIDLFDRFPAHLVEMENQKPKSLRVRGSGDAGPSSDQSDPGRNRMNACGECNDGCRSSACINMPATCDAYECTRFYNGCSGGVSYCVCVHRGFGVTNWIGPVEGGVIQPAHRNGISIGWGLFSEGHIYAGEEVVSFVDAAMMPMHEWPAYSAEHSLNEEWAGVQAQRCLPPPTKATRTVMLYDKEFVPGNPRPAWTYMNHSSRPNLEMRVPRSGYRVAWYALCDIWQGTELVFKYGGDTEEYDALDNVDSSGRIVYPRRQRRRLL
jgi:hypothetical protein